MTSEKDSEKIFSATAIESFSRRLARFAEGLSERERKILGIVLLRGIDPLDKAAIFDAPALLTKEEEALMLKLENMASIDK